MADRIPISVVILAKNEGGRLRECIESVRWAQEVLVVDDESADDTVRLAAELGARVVSRKMDVEGRHRNWASAQAAHDWILSLDADERVTPELAQEIAGLFADGGPPYANYAIPRRNYIGARWIRYGGWYPSAQLKMFNRRTFQWEEAAVRPRALSEKPCGSLKGDLLHYTYRDLSDFVEKLNRQTTLEAQKWLAGGRKMTLGKALWRSIDRFWRSFIAKKGYKDGVLGFIVAWFASAYQLLSYAKYLEGRQRAAAADAAAPAAPAPTAGRS